MSMGFKQPGDFDAIAEFSLDATSVRPPRQEVVLAGVEFISCTVLVEEHRGWDVRIVTGGEAVWAGEVQRRGAYFLSPEAASAEIMIGRSYPLWRGEAIGSLKVISFREGLGPRAGTSESPPGV